MAGDYIDLGPPRAQVKAGNLGLSDDYELVPVESDVFHVVERLKRIDPGLSLFFHKSREVFVLYWKGLNDKGELVEDFVGAYTELDGRLVHLIEKLAARENRNRYDLVKELERLEAQKDRDFEREQLNRIGPVAEQLAHALRNDLGIKNRAFMHAPKKKRRRR